MSPDYSGLEAMFTLAIIGVLAVLAGGVTFVAWLYEHLVWVR